MLWQVLATFGKGRSQRACYRHVQVEQAGTSRYRSQPLVPSIHHSKLVTFSVLQPALYRWVPVSFWWTLLFRTVRRFSRTDRAMPGKYGQCYEVIAGAKPGRCRSRVALKVGNRWRYLRLGKWRLSPFHGPGHLETLMKYCRKYSVQTRTFLESIRQNHTDILYNRSAVSVNRKWRGTTDTLGETVSSLHQPSLPRLARAGPWNRHRGGWGSTFKCSPYEVHTWQGTVRTLQGTPTTTGAGAEAPVWSDPLELPRPPPASLLLQGNARHSTTSTKSIWPLCGLCVRVQHASVQSGYTLAVPPW